MVVLPAPIPVMPTGELPFTVAIALLAVVHVPPAVPLVNVVTAPWHIVLLPVMLAGVALTVNDNVALHDPIV